MITALVDSVLGSRRLPWGSVLVAEGDSPTRRRLIEALTNAGVTAVEAADHQTALALLWANKSIDVIIAELVLPGGGGGRLVHAAQAALGREFTAVLLGPAGVVSGQETFDRNDFQAVVGAALVGLDDIAVRRLGKISPARDGQSDSLFECLAVAAEHKDNETGRHNRRIGIYAKVLAEALGWPPEQQAMIEIAATLHDIGKIGIPDSILFKPGRLTAEEMLVMQRHTLIGHTILSAARNPLLACAARIAQHHHQRYSGDGYPHPLTGEDIPIEARVTAICDVYDALRSERPYKPPLPHKEAIAILLNGDERTRPCHFDPALLSLLSKVEASFEAIFATMTGA